MKRLLLILILLGLLSPLAHAQGVTLGVGAFGGLNIPVVQDDQGNGTAFGLKARVKLLPFLTAEPNVIFGKWGEPDPVEGVELGIDGSKITSYGVDAVFGNLPGAMGFKPYALVGAAIYSVKNDDTGYDESKPGFAGGLGFGFGFSEMLDVDVRGKLIVAPQEAGSKKAVLVTGGLNYYFNIGK